mmetsp:Transcript_54126/g.97728  ORF Transcript_54126/g.97728 Transcript_54126/m.97728 type:complete len:885 (+) Transcript_54126:74-2728(+)
MPALDTGSDTLQQIQRLLVQLQEEHAKEVDDLRGELRQLQEASLESPQSPCSPVFQIPEHVSPQEDIYDNEGNELPELDSLRSAAAAFSAPPLVTQTTQPLDLDDKVAGRSTALSLDGFGEADTEISQVRAIIYALHGLPASLLQGAHHPAQCAVAIKTETVENSTPAVPLQEETPAIPGQFPQPPSSWKAEFEEGGVDVMLQLPAPLPEQVMLEIRLEGCDASITSGVLTLNAQRQNWILFGGGSVDAEIVVEKTETPMQKRRASTVRDRIIEKLEMLFCVADPAAKVVMPNDVFAAIRASRNKKSAQLTSSLGAEDMEEVVLELKRIHQKAIDKQRKPKQTATQPVIAWKQFVDCIMLEELPKYSAGPVALNLFIVQQAILGDDMPSTGTSGALLLAYEKVRKPISRSQKWINAVSALSTAAIIISFLFLGLSLDVDPDWLGWIVFDGFFAAIFVLEVVVKTYVLTPRGYFCGRDSVWNLFDVTLSAVAVGETAISILFATAGSEMKAALALRGLRLARMARLAKLMRMPLLEELANIISGFVISVRSLFWVMVTLMLVVYVLALGMRATVQTVSNGAMSTCGAGDLIDLDSQVLKEAHGGGPPECKLYHVYGEEFCGSVPGCMFTIFRCMIGECTSTAGRSLTMVFSDAFGVRFDIFYSAAMVVVLFGLFNIITAIFVEATLNGLKENETQRRYAKAYESSYMTEQLAKLVMVLTSQVQKMRSRTSTLPGLLQDTMLQGAIAGFSMGSSESPAATSAALHSEEIFLSEEEFNQLIRMPDVRMLLNELDVSVEPRPGVFEAFNTDPDGTVSISELVSGLMRLRGDLHKVDLVIAQMTLDNLQKQVEELRSSNAQIAKKIGAKRGGMSRMPSYTGVGTESLAS